MSESFSEAASKVIVDRFLEELDARINGTAKMKHSPEGIEELKAVRVILAPMMREDPVLWAERIAEEFHNVTQGQPEEAG